MNKRNSIVVGLVAVTGALWYLAAAPERGRVHDAASKRGNEAATLPEEVVSSQPVAAHSAARAGLEPAAAKGKPFVIDGAQLYEDTSNEAERAAIENAKKPAEEQSADVQQQYYRAFLEGLTRSQKTESETLDRLRAARDGSNSAARRAIDEHIATQEKLLEEHRNQLAAYAAKAGPAF